jgi:transcriptional regulator with XRE-family HTH domain
VSLKDNLINIMKLRGLNAKQLEELSGVPDSRISEIRNGITKNPRMTTINKLAKGLKVTPEILICEMQVLYEGETERMFLESLPGSKVVTGQLEDVTPKEIEFGVSLEDQLARKKWNGIPAENKLAVIELLGESEGLTLDQLHELQRLARKLKEGN